MYSEHGMEMGAGFGVMGFVLMLVMLLLLIIPFWKILPRVGVPSWVALAAVIPFGALVLLWVAAFKAPVTPNNRVEKS